MKDSLSKQIGRRVRKQRESLGFTHEELAKWANLSIYFLVAVETGKKSMTTNTLYRVARALNISTDLLVFEQQDAAEHPTISSMLAALNERDRANVEEVVTLFFEAIQERDNQQV